MTLSTFDYEDPTKLPAQQKSVKPETIRKLLTTLIFDVYNDSAANILNSLIENVSYRIEIVQVIEDKFRGFRAELYVDGQVFKSVHSAKKKAKNAVCRIALQYLFSDLIEEIKSTFDGNLEKPNDFNTTVAQSRNMVLSTSTDVMQTNIAAVPTVFNGSILQPRNDNVFHPPKTSDRSVLTAYSTIPLAYTSSMSPQADDSVQQSLETNQPFFSNNGSIPMEFSGLLPLRESNSIFQSSKSSAYSVLSSNTAISISPQMDFYIPVSLKTSHSVPTSNTVVPIQLSSSVLQPKCDNIIQPSKTSDQSTSPNDLPHLPSLLASTLQVHSKSSKVNLNSECNNRTSSIKKMRNEFEDSGQRRRQLKKQLQKLVTNPECKLSTPCRPPLQKGLKECTVKRIVEQALELYENENPNTVTALFSLFGKDAFSFDVCVFGDAKCEVTLVIGGKTYICIASSVKKGRKHVAKMALRDFFPEYAAGSSNDTGIPTESSEEVPGVCRHLQGNVPTDRSKLGIVNTVPLFKFPENPSVSMENRNEAPFSRRAQDDSVANKHSSSIANVIPTVNFKKSAMLTENRADATLPVDNSIANECSSSIVDVRPKFKSSQNSAMMIEDHKEMRGVDERLPDEAVADASSSCAVNRIPEFKVPVNSTSFNFADYIANLVEQKYEEVMHSEPEFRRRYTVLSGVVMVENNDISTSTVICVATGNKCVLGDSISKIGDVLFDCHAEILARRCLMSFFYTQIHTALTTKYKTILEMGPKSEFRVKDNIKFYLFISSAPCGDGRVFNFSHVPNPDRKQAVKRGILRVKLETGMGGIPTNEYYNTVSSYEAYLKGFPLVLMCCSAKLMMCNVVGIQGALLSHFLEPVYFDGVVIGDIFHKQNLERALFERATITTSEVRAPYRLNKPFITCNTNSKVPVNVKPGKACMNWIIHEPSVEFIQTRTGKTVDGEPSRICKRSLFEKFIRVLGVIRKLNNAPNLTYACYLNCKEDSITYQQVKKLFLTSLDENGKGKWIKTPKEVDSFSLDITDENTSSHLLN